MRMFDSCTNGGATARHQNNVLDVRAGQSFQRVREIVAAIWPPESLFPTFPSSASSAAMADWEWEMESFTHSIPACMPSVIAICVAKTTSFHGFEHDVFRYL